MGGHAVFTLPHLEIPAGVAVGVVVGAPVYSSGFFQIRMVGPRDLQQVPCSFCGGTTTTGFQWEPASCRQIKSPEQPSASVLKSLGPSAGHLAGEHLVLKAALW